MSFSKEKILKMAKGFRGRAKNCYRIAKPRVEKGLQYAYRDRKVKKREMRRLWIMQINAACRLYGVKYSHFMHGLQQQGVKLDRKSLSTLAQYEPYSFRALVLVAQRHPKVEVDERASTVRLKASAADFM